MWRSLLLLRRADLEFPVATQYLDDSCVLPWIECLGRTYRHEREVCGTRIEPRHSRRLYADLGEGMKNPKNIQEPQHYSDDRDGVQDGLDGSCHRDETVYQPKENPNHNQDQEYVK